ncbi:hypothetical protein DER45DRAFT_631614 [Fusarium avenaceum]|nr:hypothetical protein DER45DRAFT_631614 [Fusarium avenaceum]
MAAVIAVWETATRAIIVSFIPDLSIQADKDYKRILRAVKNDYEGMIAFHSTHSVSLHNLDNRIIYVCPVKDIFLTSNMMLPKPELLEAFRNRGWYLISLPFQRVASVHYGEEMAPVVDLRQLWMKPLNLKVLPCLQEFTMLCRENSIETIFDMYSDKNDFNKTSHSRMETIPEETSADDIKEIALACRSPQTGAIPSTVVRLWIMTRENEMRHRRKPNRQWTDLPMDAAFEDPNLHKNRQYCFLKDNGNVRIRN